MDSQPSPQPVLCTFSYFGKEYTPQIWYNCWTCSQSAGAGVCYACAHTCHKGHQIGNRDRELGFQYFNNNGFYCDCAVGAFATKCQCVQVVKLKGVISTVELSDTSVDYEMTKAAYKEKPFSIISPTNLKMALELGGVVFNCSDVTMPFIKTKYTQVPDPCLLVGCGVFGATSNNTQGVSFDCMVTEKNGMKLVNDYVSSQTKGMIPELLTQEPVGTTVVSTLYFKGAWLEPFQEYQTYKEYDFNGLNGKVKVPVMRKFGDKKNTRFIVSDNLKSLVLPYVGDRFVAVLTLPKIYHVSIHDMIKHPSGFFYDQWKEHLQLQNVKMLRIQHFVPKFKKRFRYNNMDQILKNAGFDLDTFREKSGVDQIVHEVVIEMDEKGTEASAASGLVSKGMPETDDDWIGDKPYMLAIVDNVTKSVLFSGIVDFTVN